MDDEGAASSCKPVASSHMDAKQQPESFDTFHEFPKLSPEIRLMIWKLAIEEPRVVKYTIKRCRSTLSSRTNLDSPPPSLLRVNHESRTEALKVIEWNMDNTNNSANKKTHVKFLRNDVDIPFLRFESIETYTEIPEDLERTLLRQNARAIKPGLRKFKLVKTLAMDPSIWENLQNDYGLLDMVPWSIKCETLMIVINEEVVRYHKEFLKSSKNDWEWKKKTRHVPREPSNIQKNGQFGEIVYNKEVAECLEDDFRENKTLFFEYWGSFFGDFDGLLPHPMSQMQIKVVSE